MAYLRMINVDLNRQYRNDLNWNFQQIEALTGISTSEIARVERESKERDDFLAGTSVDAIIQRIDTAANNADVKAVFAETQGDYAKEQGDYAKTQGDYANDKGDYANEKAVLADLAAENANTEASNLSQLKVDIVDAIQNTNKAVDDLTAIGDYDPSKTYHRKNIVMYQGSGFMNIAESTGVIPTDETHWKKIVSRGERGIPGAGSGTVSSVNGVEPDGDGNVELVIPDPDLTSLATKQELRVVRDDAMGHSTEIASSSTLGHIKVGNNLTVRPDGTVDASGGELPIASTSILGGVKVDGTSITIAVDGTISGYTPPKDDLTNAPGSKYLLGGNMQAGYFGRVPASELFTGSALAAAVGISAGMLQHDTVDWLKFAYLGKIQFRPMKAIRHSISWDQINAAGCVNGTKTVAKNELLFKVRLMRGALKSPTSNPEAPDFDAKYSEWNRLMLPIHEQAATKAWDYPAYVESDVSNWDVGFTDADLLTRTTVGNGSYVWCQDFYGPIASARIFRAGQGVSRSSSIGASTANANCGWAPILELVN